MNLGTRLKQLRTELLNEKLSMKSFGEKLGVSGDVIKNMEYNRVEIKDHMVKLICLTFNVNEEWLLNGAEPIFINDYSHMSISERLKELRKNILGLSQEEFADKLQITQAGLSKIELGGSILTERNIKLICQTFNVNEDWLRNGIEPIFKEDSKEEPSIIELLEKQGAKPMVLQIIENYLKMSDDNKKAFDNYLKKLVGVDTYNNAHQKAKDNIKNFPTYTDNEKVELVGRDKGKILISKEEYDEIIKNSEKLDPEDYDKYF